MQLALRIVRASPVILGAGSVASGRKQACRLAASRGTSTNQLITFASGQLDDGPANHSVLIGVSDSCQWAATRSSTSTCREVKQLFDPRLQVLKLYSSAAGRMIDPDCSPTELPHGNSLNVYHAGRRSDNSFGVVRARMLVHRQDADQGPMFVDDVERNVGRPCSVWRALSGAERNQG